MSEPFSLALFAHVEPDRFRAAAGTAPPPVTAFNDWDAFGLDISARDLAYAQEAMPSNGMRYLRDLRDTSVRQLGWHFEHDAATNYLTCHCLLWTDSPPEILAGLATLRDVLAASGEKPGYIIAHGYAFADNGTFGGVVVEKTGSIALPADHGRIATAVVHAQTIANRLLDQAHAYYGQSDPRPAIEDLIVDQLDTLGGT